MVDAAVSKRRWFLSYHSTDAALALRLKLAIETQDPNSSVFFAPTNLRAGGFWSRQLADEIAASTVFVLLVGEGGVGPWQVLEYDEALDRGVKDPGFAIVLVLVQGQTAPGLPFLRRLHWVVTADPSSEKSLRELFDATAGEATERGELWRYTSPYRGLAAMEAKDSDYFFGRQAETIDVIKAFASQPDKIPILLGNSGVGKSSLAQAGVIAALIRQAWPEGAQESEPWPERFKESRRWLFLSCRPGTDPTRALVDSFLETWRLDTTSTTLPERRSEWTQRLLDGTLELSDIIDQTLRRFRELNHPEPAGFLLYVDQGEELYVRVRPPEQRRFSQLLCNGIKDSRLHLFISMRSDFFGQLQKDQFLYEAHHQINVPPMREQQLREVVSRPAGLLSARFESPNLANEIARQTAEESAKDAGALPLLSYLLDDMWRRMIARGDGIIKLPAQAIDLGAVLVDRANAFVSSHPDSENQLKRIFTLNLATVREDGEPTRRRAWRSEFSEAEWALVAELANHPNRLLVIATVENSLPQPDARQEPKEDLRATYVEVAHEAVFRRWEKLRAWIASEREFLIWRGGLELARRAWEKADQNVKDDALLMGLALRQASAWLAARTHDIVLPDRKFIDKSRQMRHRRALAVNATILILVLLVFGGLGVWWQGQWLKEKFYQLAKVHAVSSAELAKMHAGRQFRECDGCPEMVLLPEGSFLMGSPAGPGIPSRERPQHRVDVKAIAVGKTEVTFAEWDLCVSYGDCDPRIQSGAWGRGLQPVINVTWHDAKRYVAWLSRVTGKPYRLLSEAEWEYAARAKQPTLYSFGNADEELLPKYGWYAKNSENRPQPVETKSANQFGLHDTHGNVFEWVEDCWHENYQHADSRSAAWTTGQCGRRVIRSGSWRYQARVLRSANRDWAPIDSREDDRGFRVARDLNH